MVDLREDLTEFLGVSAAFTPRPVEVISRVEQEGYRRELVRYRAREGDFIDAFLFVPSKPSGGAVLALHQHNSQWEIGKSEVAGLVGDPLQAFGPALARQGVTVLAPDSIGFESRMQAVAAGPVLAPRLKKPYSSADGWLQYYNQMAYRLVSGDLLLRKVLEDHFDALSILQISSGLARVGVLGHSFGGLAAMFLAALDVRVAYTCTSGAAGSIRRKLEAGSGLEMSLIIPGFLNRFDIDDVLRCVAPRRILVVSSESDPQSADAIEVVEAARSAFKERHCSESLKHLRVAGVHALDQVRWDAIVAWMVAQANSEDQT